MSQLLITLYNCSNINSSFLLSRFPLQGDSSGLMLLAGFFADAQNQEVDKNRYKEYPWPADQNNMNFSNILEPAPAIDIFFIPDLANIQVPYDLLNNKNLEENFGSKKEIIMSGVPISSPSIWQLLFQLYGCFMQHGQH